jgi:hypothetical protein
MSLVLQKPLSRGTVLISSADPHPGLARRWSTSTPSRARSTRASWCSRSGCCTAGRGGGLPGGWSPDGRGD